MLYTSVFDFIKNNTKFDDLEFVTMIGSGAFGKVYIAKHLKEKRMYAVKAVEKAEIIKGDDIDVTMAERRILTLGTKTNFLTQLHSSFQVPKDNEINPLKKKFNKYILDQR